MDGLLSKLRRVQDVPVEGKTAVIRVDYNVPLKDGGVGDDARIRSSLPTIEELLNRGAKIVLMSHLGRPEGKVVPELRLDPVARRLKELLDRDVHKLDDCIGDEVKAAIDAGEAGDVFLLENLRFHPEETADDSQFAHQLGLLGDIYVNDAFATIHRAHASTLGICDHLPSCAGLLIQKEVGALSRLIDEPERPYIAVVGGKKARSKLQALRDLIDRVDVALVGGGVAFTFLRAKGYLVGNSVVDESLVEEIKELIRIAHEKGVLIALPHDVIAAQELSDQAETITCRAEQIPTGWMGLDIGPETVGKFSEEIAKAKTVVWTGPMGAFETERFSEGTKGVAEALAASQAFTVVGGGETGEALAKLETAEGISYISTGGGACLALLRGKTLPALEALQD